MSEYGELVKAKCDAFADRVVKLNDYLLDQACKKSEVGGLRSEVRGRKFEGRVPVYLQSVATISNQLLRAGTSIGANNAEATNAVSKQDFRAKSYIALKEARESLYWIDLLHRNGYLEDDQYKSIYGDCEELVKILVSRCKKLDAEVGGNTKSEG